MVDCKRSEILERYCDSCLFRFMAFPRLVVELKRDMIVRGTLESVDAGMGLTLTNVVFENLEVRRQSVA